MTDEKLKQKCKERAKIFQQAMESCHSSSPTDCIEWFADRIAELEEENKTVSRKANEWHYVKDGDLPTKELEEEQLLVRVRNYTEDYILAYYMLDKYYSKNGKRFYSDTDCDYPINIKDIIAWKEIVFPKESE